MQPGHLIALLNHGVALSLAGAFLVLWLYQRRSTYILVLAVGFSLTSFAYLLQYVSPFGFQFSRVLSCLGFLLGSCFIAGGVILRFGRGVPYVAFAILGFGGLAAFSWFMFAQPDLTWRVYSANFALGGISLVAAAELRPARSNGPIEMMLFVLSLLSGLNFLVRTLVALWLDGPYADYDAFYASAYWVSALLSHALMSVLLALCLIGAAVLDVFNALKADSRTDPLSSLLNRRGFAERAEPLFGGYRRRPVTIALVLADLDHFKRINDTYGHSVGDRVIVAFARLLQHCGAGKEAVLARVGGEEFAIMLPNCDLAGARLLAEAIRTGLAAMAGGIPDVPPLNLTCSFGVAERAPGETIESLTERADQALMNAKRAGRDRVHVTFLRSPMPPVGWDAAPGAIDSGTRSHPV